ncbi:MalM family protein [Spartinivicinus poritis]|uniref:MalM family protein n=1 Tax=Spartinivicinus poritis TaxID=2994640 RepID=A0ABT5UHE5_9GAMM|nr:MalM family protein [Spartinivicinus sp. A2-2]MDE1465630.1 MalM family protein [Spartinivicinus sp. A2-2]
MAIKYKIQLMVGAVLIVYSITGWTGSVISKATQQQVSQANTALKSASSCCSSLANLQYQPLEANKTTDVVIDSGSPVFEFDTGKSYLAAYKLPANQRSMQIKLYSKAGKTVYSPSVLLLDSEFRITRILADEDFVYRPAWGFKTDSIDGTFRIDRSQPGNPYNEMYLVIFSTAAQMQGQTTLVHPAKAFAKARYNQPPDIPDPIALHSPTGHIELMVEEEGNSFYEKKPYIPKFYTPNAVQSVAKQPVTSHQVQPETQHYFEQAINKALQQGNVSKALNYVEEAERVGIKNIRQYFIERVQPKK